jgi:NAD(P)-dependent dehydrogenase (short-subunit alcohol dehydrogenase family)
MLKNKIAIVYGASGGIGGAVARAFADQGVTLFLTGRDRTSVDSLAKDIVSSGGSAVPAQVDALDEQAVDTHLQSVIDGVGRVDISFNAVGIPNARILGVPLVDLELGQFSRPITAYTESYFLTARLAARRMIPNKSGVIMTVTALHSRTGLPLVGGYGPAMAAKEALTRDLSGELAPHGISRRRAAATGHAGDTHDQGCIRTARQGDRHDVGTVARIPCQQDASTTTDGA